MKRTTFIFCLFILALVFAGAAAWAWWVHSSNKAFEQYLESLSARGVKTRLNEYVTPLPDEENALFLWEAANAETSFSPNIARETVSMCIREGASRLTAEERDILLRLPEENAAFLDALRHIGTHASVGIREEDASKPFHE